MLMSLPIRSDDPPAPCGRGRGWGNVFHSVSRSLIAIPEYKRMQTEETLATLRLQTPRHRREFRMPTAKTKQRERSLEITRARELRNNPTLPEKVLWHYLRNRQLKGLKFRRQCPLGAYKI